MERTVDAKSILHLFGRNGRAQRNVAAVAVQVSGLGQRADGFFRLIDGHVVLFGCRIVW